MKNEANIHKNKRGEGNTLCKEAADSGDGKWSKATMQDCRIKEEIQEKSGNARL